MNEAESRLPLIKKKSKNKDGDDDFNSTSTLDDTTCCRYRIEKGNVKCAAIGCIVLFAFLFISVPLLLVVMGKMTPTNHIHHEPSPVTPVTSFPYQHPRLPEHIIPVFYLLKLNIRFDKLIADGQVDITLHVTKPTNYIVFHHSLIDIHSLQVRQSQLRNFQSIKIKDKKYSRSLQMLYIKLSEDLKININYTLSVKFTSKVFTDRLKGLYLNNYTDVQGTPRLVCYDL